MRHCTIFCVLIALVFGFVSCSETIEPDFGFENTDSKASVKTDETKALILYAAGYNSLSSHLKGDINDLISSYVPEKDGDMLFVFSHLTSAKKDYVTETEPSLVRVYSEKNRTVCDTLFRMPAGTNSTSAETMNSVLEYIRDNFKADSWNMVFSSHATGWLPEAYYSNSKQIEAAGKNSARRSEFLYTEEENDENLPEVKSVGQMVQGNVASEMNIKDFAAAIPMYMDCIFFDACLMGGIEVAYELKDICGKVGFSQTEVLADGLNYKKLAENILKKNDAKKVCEDFFTQYESLSGNYRSATISLIDCTKLDALAAVCRNIFDSNRENISKISKANVQKYYRGDHPWFFDMQSVIENTTSDAAQLESFKKALNACVLYKASTERFMETIALKTVSGFSMYIPSTSAEYLNNYYMGLQWNKATGLVM